MYHTILKKNNVIYPENFEQKIEFTRVRQLVADRCLSTLGREKVEEMHFSVSHEEIVASLSRTEEFVRILQEEDSFPADHFYDMRPILRHIRVEGSWIDLSALFELRRSLQTINGIVAFLHRDEEKDAKYPCLLALTGNVATYPEITKKTDTILDGFGMERRCDRQQRGGGKERQAHRRISPLSRGAD